MFLVYVSVLDRYASCLPVYEKMCRKFQYRIWAFLESEKGIDWRKEDIAMRVLYNSDLLREDLHGKLIQYVNARVLLGNQLIDDHIWVRNGKIISAASVFYDERREADIQIDCQGKILCPGFIDIQLNGAFGVDFSSIGFSKADFSNGVQKVRKGLLAFGVTSFLPTIITSTAESYNKILPLIKRCPGSPEGAAILGVHVEGPFISQQKRGCHPIECVRDFGENYKKEIAKTYGSLENISMVTIAPEKEHALDAIKYFKEEGIICSLGHSSACWEEGVRGVQAGALSITHLFNAMQSYHHRDPGLIGLLTTKFKEKTHPLFYGIIADGIHTHDSALRIAHQTLPEGLVLVTDAIAALGLGDGIHKLGQQKIIVTGYEALLDGTQTPAGSVASMPFCIRHFVQAARCSLQDALNAATLKPATLLGITDTKGVLKIGADADLVLLDDDVTVFATFIGGQLAYFLTNC
ncbi:unnamed protein product, partial [Mesorhabditis belari]|uniref:N-acetylglucosamine-6-phosphate deacetylase n=1 Tax=Mesorhabditis belari TaxID=2138241 RepID=A0AAF3E906_9BILA